MLKSIDLVPWRPAPQYTEARYCHNRKGFVTWTNQLVRVFQRGGIVWEGYKSVYLPYYDGVAQCTFRGRWCYTAYEDRGKYWRVLL